MTVQFPYFRPSGFFFFLDRSLLSFMTSSFLPLDRSVFSFEPPTFAQDRPKTVHILTTWYTRKSVTLSTWLSKSFGPSSWILMDRELWRKTVHFGLPLVHSKAIVSTSSRYFPHYCSKFDWIFKLPLTFLTSIVSNFIDSFQVHSKLSNFISRFPISFVLSNLSPNFPTSIFPISYRTFQLLVFFQLSFPTTRIPKENTKMSPDSH